MDTFKEIDTIYENFFSEAEEEEDDAPLSVMRLMETPSMRGWEPIPVASDAFSVKVDDVERNLLQVAIKEAKIISERIFKDLKKQHLFLTNLFDVNISHFVQVGVAICVRVYMCECLI